MEKVHYKVDGLANSESKTKVRNSLDKIQGVQEIAVDLSRGTVEVEYNPPATPEQIRTTIEKAGYDVQ
jgi:copper chaperone CopZ